MSRFLKQGFILGECLFELACFVGSVGLLELRTPSLLGLSLNRGGQYGEHGAKNKQEGGAIHDHEASVVCAKARTRCAMSEVLAAVAPYL